MIKEDEEDKQEDNGNVKSIKWHTSFESQAQEDLEFDKVIQLKTYKINDSNNKPSNPNNKTFISPHIIQCHLLANLLSLVSE